MGGLFSGLSRFSTAEIFVLLPGQYPGCGCFVPKGGEIARSKRRHRWSLLSPPRVTPTLTLLPPFSRGSGTNWPPTCELREQQHFPPHVSHWFCHLLSSETFWNLSSANSPHVVMDLYFKKLLIFTRPQEGEYFDLTKIELALGFISDSFFPTLLVSVFIFVNSFLLLIFCFLKIIL